MSLSQHDCRCFLSSLLLTKRSLKDGSYSLRKVLQTGRNLSWYVYLKSHYDCHIPIVPNFSFIFYLSVVQINIICRAKDVEANST